jgi:hypothetical protein
MSGSGENKGKKFATSVVPSELQINQKWDWALNEVGYKVAVGTVVAGVAAVVLSRGPKMRAAITSFGGGFGAGWAYKVVNDEFSGIGNNNNT